MKALVFVLVLADEQALKWNDLFSPRRSTVRTYFQCLQNMAIFGMETYVEQSTQWPPYILAAYFDLANVPSRGCSCQAIQKQMDARGRCVL